MSQQRMNFDENHRDEPTSYSAGYEEVPHYNVYSSGSLRLKLTPRGADNAPTMGQRLALAIVSLLVLMLTLFVGVGLAFSGLIPGMVAIPFLGFVALIIMLSTVFNLRREL
jgi:hypothetical protein